MLARLNASSFQVVAFVEAPKVIGWVELTGRLFKYLEAETCHITYQHDCSQLRVLLRCLFDTGIPDL